MWHLRSLPAMSARGTQHSLGRILCSHSHRVGHRATALAPTYISFPHVVGGSSISWPPDLTVLLRQLSCDTESLQQLPFLGNQINQEPGTLLGIIIFENVPFRKAGTGSQLQGSYEVWVPFHIVGNSATFCAHP